MKVRTKEEMLKMEREFELKVWYDRKQMLKEKSKNNKTGETEKDIWEGMLKAEKEVIEEFGIENLGPYTKFEWGELMGKLQTIRWVLGCEWGNCDS